MSKKLFFVVTFVFTAFLIFSCSDSKKEVATNNSDQKPNLLEMYTPPKTIGSTASMAKVHVGFTLGNGSITLDEVKEYKYATDGTTTLVIDDYGYMNATQNFINTATVDAMGLVNLGFVNLYYRSNDIKSATATTSLTIEARVDGFAIGTFGDDAQKVDLYMKDSNAATTGGPTASSGDNVADGDDWSHAASDTSFDTEFTQLTSSATACGGDVLYEICTTAAGCDGVGATDVVMPNIEFMINADLPNGSYTGDIYFEVCDDGAAFTTETNPDKTIANPDVNPNAP